MYLRFENNLPVYSFNETEKEKLNRVIEELNKIRYLPWEYLDESCSLLSDDTTIKILKIFLRSKFENNICIEGYKENETSYQKILNNYLYILYEYSKKDKNEIPKCIQEEIKNYDFILSNRFQIVTILKKPGIVDQYEAGFNDVYGTYRSITNTTIQNCYNKSRIQYL